MKKLQFVISILISAMIVSACSATRELNQANIISLETRDESNVEKMIIRFDRVTIGTRNDSLRISGKTMTVEHKPIPGVHIQFGVWKTSEEGSYFIIREEFLTDTTGSFDVRTHVQADEWMVFESDVETRFFDIRGAW